MDESNFPGQPKFNRGRRLGTTWEEDDKWVFGLTARKLLIASSKNNVNPDTGAHTQTIEDLWSHVKDFLPVHGMKPCDLGS